MIYYSITMYEKKQDDINSINGPFSGGIKGKKWLRFSGDDNGLQLNEKREDENLAIQILIQNLEKVELELFFTNDPSISKDEIGKSRIEIKNEDDLLDLLHGTYEKVTVEKYESNLNIR